jgi:hypothetical protein
LAPRQTFAARISRPIPQSAAAVLIDRTGESFLVGYLVGALLAEAEELADVDKRTVALLVTLPGGYR